ncbi:hypothetical protein LCGC14_1611950 [marine sediment metagenome]|uniref:Uncharacterized protein n=1 Tax=marine sediment metagenome TaxID=412755 RepID=A0A0F9KNQ7_9ZZZZ|nr:hypothetical protein [Candidatus Aminicenantes bacterium]HEB34998.1 hypothetical protein [Candidatus Aminicenantes bacterium]
MIERSRLSLNLASHPLRNRRFFYLILSSLVVALLLISFFAGKIFVEYKAKAQETRASVKRTDKLIKDVQRDEEDFSAKIEDAIIKYKGKVDLINSIILGKSFSWIEFLSDLENSLPDSSYIVSMAPTLAKDSKVQLSFKVVYSSVNDLLELYNNLKALKFNQIRIISEEENERGLFLSEISLNYEKDI